MKQGAFACPAAAHETYNFTGIDLQVNAFEYFQLTISFGNIFATQHRIQT